MKALVAAMALAAGFCLLSAYVVQAQATGKCGVIIKTVEGAASVVDGEQLLLTASQCA